MTSKNFDIMDFVSDDLKKPASKKAYWDDSGNDSGKYSGAERTSDGPFSESGSEPGTATGAESGNGNESGTKTEAEKPGAYFDSGNRQPST
ncbi:MAG: hypothetical protein PHW56_07760, partial [Methanosarcinaceae archaeon]|nr:hypothetical protein [Methanosarcinaceae archaeon]